MRSIHDADCSSLAVSCSASRSSPRRAATTTMTTRRTDTEAAAGRRPTPSHGDDARRRPRPATTRRRARTRRRPATTAGRAEAEAALADLVAAAQEEGSVTIYSSQGLDQLNALGEAFEEEYGIAVEVVRSADADMIPRVETELSTDTSGGDLVVTAAQAWIETHAAAGDCVDPTASPQLAGLGDYDAEQYMHEGNIFEVGAAMLTFAWNTDLVPDGLTDYPDLLDPSLAGGKVGVPDPAIGPALVDFYLWLEEEFGEEYVTAAGRTGAADLPELAADRRGAAVRRDLRRRLRRPGAARAGQGVRRAGRLRDLRGAGAWGARYFGAIPTSSDSPNAAALLADFMVTAEGQELVQGASGSVLPDIPGTLITNDRVRGQDLEATAPEPAAAYVEEWNAMFR